MEPGAEHGHTSLLTYMAVAGVPCLLKYANTYMWLVYSCLLTYT